MSRMLCAWCSRVKEWPSDFPDRLYAICKPCQPAWRGDNERGVFLNVWRWFRRLFA